MRKFLLIFLMCLMLPVIAGATKNAKDGVEMFCSNCGTKVDNSAKFCMNCGNNLSNNEKAPVKPQSTTGFSRFPPKVTMEDLQGRWVFDPENAAERPSTLTNTMLYNPNGRSSSPKTVPTASFMGSATLYVITINGDAITITQEDKLIVDTTFYLRNDELINTTKRKNWQDYAEFHQNDPLASFDSVRFVGGRLVGYIFVADLGSIEVPYKKTEA